LKTKLVEKEKYIMLMGIFMMDNLKMINLMDMEF
jgi:hypothetical protein